MIVREDFLRDGAAGTNAPVLLLIRPAPETVPLLSSAPATGNVPAQHLAEVRSAIKATFS